ncbi:MAG: flagellar motor protein MotB [Defluviicoccus sp.]
MIIIKRVKKGGHAAHGGAWKVAYADFVTAMMAFFLLLWLLNAVSQEQLEGISDYFAPISTQKSTSGGGGLLQGRTVDAKGVFNAVEKRHHTFAQFDQPDNDEEGEVRGSERGDRAPPRAARSGANTKAVPAAEADPAPAGGEAAAAAVSARADAEQREKAQFERAESSIREAIEANPELKQLVNSLLIDETPDGLRIQIIDQDGLAMFPRGSSVMHLHTERLLELVAKVIMRMPQPVEIAGHTDATPFTGSSGYTNWELSADRANAARRALLQLGVGEVRFSRVVGMAATVPLFPKDPKAPGNRRLSVLLLRTAPPAT